MKIILLLAALLMVSGCQRPTDETQLTNVRSDTPRVVELNDAEIENLVRRSYQYVAMYNVTNKFAMYIDTTAWHVVAFEDRSAQPGNRSSHCRRSAHLQLDAFGWLTASRTTSVIGGPRQ